MKKSIFLSILFILSLYINSLATIRVITVQNYYFSPTPMVAYVGDTIKWQWVNGLHTTTSLTYPDSALGWDAVIDGNNQSFLYVIQFFGAYNYHCSRHFNMGMTGVIDVPEGIRKIESFVPDFELMQNYPNPFNPSTTIKFSVAKESFVKLKIFDVTGKQLATLVNEKLQTGLYEVPFSADRLTDIPLPSGVYFYQLQTSEFIKVKRMMLIK